MTKALIQVLVSVGILFLLIGLLSPGMGTLGLVLLVVGLYLAAGPNGVLRQEQVLDSWSVLIENGQGKADEVFQDTENFIKESKAPAIEIKRREMTPGIIRGVLGVKRDFLAVTVQGNIRLDPYQIFVNAGFIPKVNVDQGNTLQIISGGGKLFLVEEHIR